MVSLHEQGLLAPEHSSTFRAPRPREELYDVKNDPYSFRNLSQDAEHEGVLGELRAVLDEWKVETEDIAPPERRLDMFYRKTGEFLPRYKERRQ